MTMIGRARISVNQPDVRGRSGVPKNQAIASLLRTVTSGLGLGDADQVSGNRLCLSLQRELPELCASTGIECRIVRGCAQQDLAAFRLRLKTSSGVRHVAERGEILEPAAADVADILLAGTDADTDIEPVALRCSVAHCMKERTRSVHGLARIPWSCQPRDEH